LVFSYVAEGPVKEALLARGENNAFNKKGDLMKEGL
jgi:hypothetical protein